MGELKNIIIIGLSSNIVNYSAEQMCSIIPEKSSLSCLLNYFYASEEQAVSHENKQKASNNAKVKLNHLEIGGGIGGLIKYKIFGNFSTSNQRLKLIRTLCIFAWIYFNGMVHLASHNSLMELNLSIRTKAEHELNVWLHPMYFPHIGVFVDDEYYHLSVPFFPQKQIKSGNIQCFFCILIIVLQFLTSELVTLKKKKGRIKDNLKKITE